MASASALLVDNDPAVLTGYRSDDYDRGRHDPDPSSRRRAGGGGRRRPCSLRWCRSKQDSASAPGSSTRMDTSSLPPTSSKAPTGVVRFADGNQAEGVVLGTDTVHDVAVIEVDTDDTPLAPLALDEELVSASWRSPSAAPGVWNRRLPPAW